MNLMPSLTLTAEELVEITGFKHPNKQLKVLQRLGLPAFMRPNNTVSLGRAQYENWVSRSDASVPKLDEPEMRL
jgi:hypothetical protein